MHVFFYYYIIPTYYFVTAEIPGLAFIKHHQEPRAQLLWELHDLNYCCGSRKMQNYQHQFIYTLGHLINTGPKIHRLYFLLLLLCYEWASVKLCVIVPSLQRRGLVAGALPDHWRERLHPQQLCGSIRLHPGRRVKPCFFSPFLPCLFYMSSMWNNYHLNIQEFKNSLAFYLNGISALKRNRSSFWEIRLLIPHL